MAELALPDSEIAGAIEYLVAAEHSMLNGNATRPTDGFDSLTGIAAEIDLYLRGMQVGRAALADAARTAGQGLRELMQEAHSLDANLAASLGGGFAVAGFSDGEGAP